MRHLALLVLLFCSATAFGQRVLSGKVTGDGEPLPFVHVIVSGNASATDSEGRFTMDIPETACEVQISALGYVGFRKKIASGTSDIVDFDINLESLAVALNEAVVTGTMREISVLQSPVKTEVISSELLESVPNYSLIDAIGMVNGVQEVVSCGVCGTNDIHINGMEGAYTLVLIDGMPIMSSLASVYGFNGIPTSLVEQVEIIKGPSSTLYGTEAVGGVINIITKSPENTPKLGLSTSYSTHQEMNLDALGSLQLGNKLSATVAGNVFNNSRRLDFNEDTFTDIPLSERYSLFTKLNVKRPADKKASLAVRYYDEERFGGVLNWEKANIGSDSIYGEFIATRRMEVIGSYQLPGKVPLKLDASAVKHEQNSYYGDVPFNATQEVLFANLVFQEKFKKHFLTSGLANRLQRYADNTPAQSDPLTYIPGVFIQDEWVLSNQWTVLSGARLDHHENHGWIFSPRLNVKYKPGDFSTVRVNTGNGFRVVNVFTEDHAALTGARQVIISDQLDPEESWNLSLNFNQVYSFTKLGYGTLDVDVFSNWFSNKIIPNYDIDPDWIVYDNLSGRGVARGAAFSINHTFSKRLRFSTGMTFLDVFEIEEDGSHNREKLVPEWSGNGKLGYRSENDMWSVNYTFSLMGPMELPTYAAEFERAEKSSVFGLHHVKAERNFNDISVFVAVKNLFNYTQESPLIDPSNPFGPNFDTSYAYGPLQPRRIVFGLSLNLAKD